MACFILIGISRPAVGRRRTPIAETISDRYQKGGRSSADGISNMRACLRQASSARHRRLSPRHRMLYSPGARALAARAHLDDISAERTLPLFRGDNGERWAADLWGALRKRDNTVVAAAISRIFLARMARMKSLLP